MKILTEINDSCYFMRTIIKLPPNKEGLQSANISHPIGDQDDVHIQRRIGKMWTRQL